MEAYQAAKAAEAANPSDKKDHDDARRNGSSYSPPLVFPHSTQLITGCHICPQQSNLNRCGGCRVVYYCSHQHQAADRRAHKAVCKSVINATALLKADEEALRSHKGDEDTPPNAFETEVGHFWWYRGTRNYMKARYTLMRILAPLDTRQAVQTALEHALGIMHLNPEDPMCVRSIAAPLFLRLGRDQECYALCKWWVTTGCDVDYEWKGNKVVPHETLADAMEATDVFEGVRKYGPGSNSSAMPSFADLSYVVSVTLVKVRILLHLKALQERKGASSEAPADQEPRTFVSNIVASRPEILNAEDQTMRIKEMERQVKRMYAVVQRVNKFFWPTLVKPGAHLMANPLECSMGSEAEAQMKLQECHNSWAETPGAIDVILYDFV